MKVVLKDFRAHFSAEYEIKEDKLTLISGNSGVGKSTILDAIYWCLYGSLKKVASFGKSKCTVKIQTNEINISRSTGPAILKVVYEKKDYEQEQAQEIINRYFGDEDRFLSSCYLSQMNRNLLLTGTKEDRMKIIRSIALDEDKIVDYKKKIKAKIKEKQKQVDKLRMDHKFNKRKLKEFPHAIVFVDVPDVKELKEKIRDGEKIKILYDKREADLKNITEQLQKLGDYVEVREDDIKRKERKVRLEKEVSEIEDVIEDDLESKYRDAKELEEFGKIDIQSYMEELKTLIESVQIPLSCPHCSKDVSFDPIAECLNKTFVKKKKDKTTYDPKWNVNLKKLEYLLPLNLKSSDFYRNKMRQKEKKERLLAELEELKDVQCNMDVEELQKLKQIEMNNKKISELKTMKDHLLGDTYVLDPDLEQNKVTLKKIKEDEKNNKIFTEWLECSKKAETSSTLYRKEEEELGLLLKLQEIIKTAEVTSLQNLLNMINSVLNSVLEQIFDETIIVEFSAIRELKTGKEKNEFNIKLNYRGFTYDNIKQLSGGELDRLSFAVTLTMNRITNSKMLLLDECMNSLDGELRDKVLTVLKANKSLWTVCINHEIIKGIFDEITEIET